MKRRRNHYENLGVAPDASDVEIKRAYRRRAKETHPDKGGDDAEFNEVNRAYKTLSDPGRKLLYDRTGNDERPPIEKEVQATLMFLFERALMSDDEIEILPWIRLALKDGISDAATSKRMLRAKIKKLEAKRSRFKATGTNVVHMIIDQALDGINSQIAALDHKAEIGKASLKTLDDYSEDYQPPVQPASPFTMTFDFGYMKPSL